MISVYRPVGVLAVHAALILTAQLVLTPAAFAQRGVVELSKEQAKLNNEAISALAAQPADAQKAMKLVEAALLLEPKGNVLFLTLGRAQQLAGQCIAAGQSFESALTAPAVKSVDRDGVTRRIEQFRAEMKVNCPGTVTVHCSNDELELQLGDHKMRCGATQDVAPGQYNLVGMIGSRMVLEQTVTVRSLEQERIHLSVDLESQGSTVHVAGTDPAGRVALAVSEAQNAQLREHDRLEEARMAAEKQMLESERKGLERDRMDVERQRLAAEKRQLEEERQRLAQGASSPDSAEGDDAGAEGGHKPSGRGKGKLDMSADNPNRGWLGQFQVTAPFGGFAVKANDGFADGGMVYGGTGALHFGYAFSHLLAVEAYGQLNLLFGAPLGMKSLQGRDEFNDQEIGYDTLRYLGEAKAWLGFLSPGFFVDHRSQTLSFAQGTRETGTTVMGPALSISTGGIFRDDGYVTFTGRWAPFVDGAKDQYSVEVSAASGYAQFAVEYTTLTGSEEPASMLDKGELLLFSLGIRIPFQF